MSHDVRGLVGICWQHHRTQAPAGGHGAQAVTSRPATVGRPFAFAGVDGRPLPGDTVVYGSFEDARGRHELRAVIPATSSAGIAGAVTGLDGAPLLLEPPARGAACHLFAIHPASQDFFAASPERVRAALAGAQTATAWPRCPAQQLFAVARIVDRASGAAVQDALVYLHADGQAYARLRLDAQGAIAEVALLEGEGGAVTSPPTAGAALRWAAQTPAAATAGLGMTYQVIYAPGADQPSNAELFEVLDPSPARRRCTTSSSARPTRTRWRPRSRRSRGSPRE